MSSPEFPTFISTEELLRGLGLEGVQTIDGSMDSLLAVIRSTTGRTFSAPSLPPSSVMVPVSSEQFPQAIDHPLAHSPRVPHPPLCPPKGRNKTNTQAVYVTSQNVPVPPSPLQIFLKERFRKIGVYIDPKDTDSLEEGLFQVFDLVEPLDQPQDLEEGKVEFPNLGLRAKAEKRAHKSKKRSKKHTSTPHATHVRLEQKSTPPPQPLTPDSIFGSDSPPLDHPSPDPDMEPLLLPKLQVRHQSSFDGGE